MNSNIIEQYLNGSLSPEDLQAFEAQLATDTTLSEAVFFQKILQQTAQQYNQVRQVAQTLANLRQQRTDIAGNSYTLEELLAMFAPSSYYEEELALTRSGSNSSVQFLKPLPDADCLHTLTIEFATALLNPATVWVENNLEETVISEQTIAASNTAYSLDIGHLKPGRYYWKLTYGEDTFIGGFYIQKSLMPPG